MQEKLDVINLKVFDPFFIVHFIASPVAELIRSERFYLEVNRVILDSPF